MKKLIFGAVLITAAYTIQSCSASRSATGPSGTGNTGYGSASNISAGRNGDGVPGGITKNDNNPVNAASSSAGGTDSLSDKVDAAKNKVAQFIYQASLTSYTEVESSKIALQNAKNTYVKTFAALVVDDHAKADAALKALAVAKNVTLDSVAINKDRDEKVKQFSTVTGEELESVYIQLMTKDYEQAIALYEDGERSRDAEVKAYAKENLPMLKSHLKIVSSLNKQ